MHKVNHKVNEIIEVSDLPNFPPNKTYKAEFVGIEDGYVWATTACSNKVIPWKYSRQIESPDKFEPGEPIEVSNSKTFPKAKTTPGVFVAKWADTTIAHKPGDYRHVSTWKYARKKPATPYTYETFPKGLTWIRHKGVDEEILVTARRKETVVVDGLKYKYEELGEGFELSTDNCETWYPAHL